LHTVLICDTEPIAMEGLRSLLASSGRLRVIAAETSLLEAMDAVRELHPSMVVLDKALGAHAVLDWLRALRRFPESPAVVVWGAALSQSEALRFLHAGAAGAVRKSSRLDSVLQCVRTAAAGGTWMEDDMLPAADFQSRPAHSPLTLREAEVMELVQQGMKNKEIALTLGIRVGTVKIHVKHIFEKTGIHGRHSLAISGLKKRGLLPAMAV
jgi:DNA-binding NarL/FixJ family response regulator